MDTGLGIGLLLVVYAWAGDEGTGVELVIDEPHVLQTPGSTAGISLSLALTLSARLCHEIAGTLGAMSGLLDMVEEQPEDRKSVV